MTSLLTLTPETLAEYRTRGYWRSPKLLDDAQIARLRHEVERVCRGERDFDNFHWLRTPTADFSKPDVMQVCNAWWVNQAIRDVITSPVIGNIGAQLMDTPEVRVWHDQVILKPGVGPDGAQERAGNVGWHQDYAHWQCANTSNMCTAWIALQDTNLTNGGMRTIVGSHAWGLAGDAYTFGDTDLEGLRARFAKADRPWIDEPCILRAGEASFHHALTFHGSGPNLTHEPRMSIVVHMMPAECGLKPDGRYHQNTALMGPFVRAGDRFAGPNFPTIWPPAATKD